MQDFRSKQLYKRYLNVICECSKEGQLKPLYLRWDNGVLYKIDKVLEVRKAASQVGGNGILYRIMVQGKERKLFYELNRWFIESFTP